MLKSRIFTKALGGVLQKVPSRNSAFGDGKIPMPGFNDLPQPKMGWKKYQAAQQRKYNSVLALGAVTFIIGVASFFTFVNLHFSPPKNPNS